MSFDADADLQQGLSSAKAAADQDKITAIRNGDKIGATMGDNMPIKDWMSNLPKNITVGVMDAARNTVDSVNAFGSWLDKNRNQKERTAREDGTDLGGPPEATPAERRAAAYENNSPTAAIEDDHPFRGHHSFRAWFQSFRDEIASGSTTSDEVTQGISQFAIPMLGWTKMLGVQKAISLAGFGAEALTASTALDPHGGRNADLIAAGKTVEGKLGEALQTISPDGSALNAYINYMTDRTNEGEAEGRFKNVIDSLVSTASGAALLKTGATAIKVGRQLPLYIAQNAGAGPVGAAAQEGKIVFHGTPHDFNEFDSSKIGTGEGNQSYGHGLYFAEDAATAGSYQKRLSFRNPDIAGASQEVANFSGSKPKAYTSLMMKADQAPDRNIADSMRRQAGLIKSGAVDKGGKLLHVDIPDEHIANMLDHDASMADQPHVLSKIPAEDQAKIEGMLEDHGKDGDLTDYTGNQFRQLVRRAISEDYLNFTPADGNFDNLEKAAAEYLADKGIPGIKYFDKGSRNAGTGTRNIVLFNARHAKIIKKD